MTVPGALHHLELYVRDLERSSELWGWLLTTLGYEPMQEWDEGISWTLPGGGRAAYVALVQAPEGAADLVVRRYSTSFGLASRLRCRRREPPRGVQHFRKTVPQCCTGGRRRPSAPPRTCRPSPWSMGVPVSDGRSANASTWPQCGPMNAWIEPGIGSPFWAIDSSRASGCQRLGSAITVPGRFTIIGSRDSGPAYVRGDDIESLAIDTRTLLSPTGYLATLGTLGMFLAAGRVAPERRATLSVIAFFIVVWVSVFANIQFEEFHLGGTL